MKLPEAQRAVIAPAKIQNYLVSTSHPIGRFKEPFFANLGYTVANWQKLEQDLLALAASGEAKLGRESPYGQKYEIHGTLNGPSGKSARVLTVWIVRFRSDVPQFVTAYPGENPMKYKLLDTVVLDRDLPEHSLRAGDLGTVVEVYEPDGLEVEFVTASGKTQALVTLNVKDVRPVQDGDLVAVRSVA